MLTLIEGGFFAGGKEKIKAMINERTLLGKSSLLIVPEQETVRAESEMASLLPTSAPLIFEVTNFTRFANTVFRTLGGLSKTSADASRRALIMWRAITELSAVLETVNTKEVSYGSVRRMMSTVLQMQKLALDAKDLFGAAEDISKDGATDARLPAKLRDVASVMALYKKLLSEKFGQDEDELLSAFDKLNSAPHDFLKDTHIFIDGFTSFTEPQYKIIEALMSRCELTVNLILPKDSPDAYEYKETKDTHQRLIKLSSLHSIDVKLDKLSGIKTPVSPLICDTVRLIWRSYGKLDDDFLKSDTIKIYEAKDPHEECDFIASDIKRRVMNGAKYSDFGVIARSTEPYEALLQIAFDKVNVPIFISARVDIAAYEVIKLIYSAFAAISNGFERRDVIAYSKCSLSGVDEELSDEFELYAEKWQISGKRFTEDGIWNMNPSGYTERRSEADENKLLLIDRARKSVILPLMKLEAELSSSETVKEYTEALVNFMLYLNIDKGLEEKSKEAMALLGKSAAENISRLWQTICDSLDGLCQALGDIKTNTRTYLNLLKISFSETNIGKIPAFTEEVIFADAVSARMGERKYIYIMGVNASEFPAGTEDNSYFTENDRRELSKLGLMADTNEALESARELYLFTRAMSFAKEQLTLTYHLSDASFNPSAKSDIIGRLRELSDGKIATNKISDMPMKERAYSPEFILEHINEIGEKASVYKEAVGKTKFKINLDISEKDIRNSKLKLSNDTLEVLYGNKIRMTQGKLEKYVKCPMSYFCTYNLSLHPEERAEFDARNIGTFIHAVLENFFLKLKKEGKKIADTDESERLLLIKRVAEEYTSRAFEGIPRTSARLNDTIDKICRAAKPIIDTLCDEFSDCKYEPTFFELEIENDKSGAVSAPKFNTDSGKEVYLSGKIDRVDVYSKDDKAYIRVIDYKSGNKVFSPSDIEKGLNLQMFLYLKSITDTDDKRFKSRIGADASTRLIPAGVIYVKTDISEAKISHDNSKEAYDAVKKKQARLGMLLDDEVSIAAMNRDFLPIKYKKDGAVDHYSKDKLYTEEGWKSISQAVDRAVTDICTSITCGDIPAKAFERNGEKSPCNYCDFKAICRNSK